MEIQLKMRHYPPQPGCRVMTGRKLAGAILRRPVELAQ
jgi:hypothetical protein